MPKAAAMAKAVLNAMILMTCLAGVSGCSTAVDHPSLAPRAIERFTAAEPAPAPLPPAALPEDASRQERVRVLTTQAVEADARFREGLAEAQGTVSKGAGAAPGSEAWVQAQQAISRIEILREPVSRNLADLDALQVAAVQAGVGTDAAAELDAAIQKVGAIDAQEEQAVVTLRALLANP